MIPRKIKKIIAVSGARSEYDLLFSVYKKLNEDSDFDFSVIITGPNLSDNYGYAASQIEKDGFRIISKIHNLVDSSEKIGRIASIGNQISGLANVISFEKPDIVLVAGDREEAISVTMCCAFLDIAVAHFFGGDVAKDGNIDNSIRYAASKFAHLHFPTLQNHKENLLKLGENEWRINVVGNPALDRFRMIPKLSKTELFNNIEGCPDGVEEFCVLIQHPIITEVEDLEKHMMEILDGLITYTGKVFVNYPNSDAGNFKIIQVYKEYQLKFPEKFIQFHNLDRKVYVNLLRNADFLIGNSSSGLVEVASLGLAAINVGSRQRSRIHGENVIFVDYNKNEICSAIYKVKNDNDFITKVNQKNNPYGNGNSAKQVVDVLKSVVIRDELIYKNITY